MAQPSFELEGLGFQIVEPRVLSEKRWGEIQQLRQSFFSTVFQHRTEAEVNRYVSSLTLASWNDPNASKELRGTYARPRVVVAIEDKNSALAGFIYGADNVSSSLPGLLGAAERFAKLHMFETKRYAWGREYITNNDRRAGLVTVLGALMYKSFSEDQPASWYPWTEEIGLQNQLKQWKFQPDMDNDGPRTSVIEGPFGRHQPPAQQQRWTTQQVGLVLDAIYVQPEASEAIRRAEQTLPTL